MLHFSRVDELNGLCLQISFADVIAIRASEDPFDDQSSSKPAKGEHADWPMWEVSGSNWIRKMGRQLREFDINMPRHLCFYGGSMSLELLVVGSFRALLLNNR